jgi:hypothetical protein
MGSITAEFCEDGTAKRLCFSASFATRTKFWPIIYKLKFGARTVKRLLKENWDYRVFSLPSSCCLKHG